MLPLVSVPAFVAEYAQQFQDLFSPELYEHFARYLAGLYVCERRNAQAINDTFVVQVKNQSSLNRFLTEYAWSTEQVNERRLRLLRAAEQTRPRRSSVLPLDDTFNEKSGQHFAQVGKFYISSKKHYAWAHNLVTLHYADAVCDYPLELQLYQQLDVARATALLDEHGVPYKAEVLARKKTEADRRRYLGPKLRSNEALALVFPSKIQLACQLVDWAVEHEFTQPFVFDSWYTCKELCQHITSRGRDWIGTVDGSEGIYWQGRWQSLTDWVQTRPPKDFAPTRFKYRDAQECYWAGTWVAQVGKLGRVRLVASYKKEDRSDTPKFLLTASQLVWERQHILERRRRRWTIETSYEDVKGALGFDEYEVRDSEAIKRHWY